MCSCAHIAISAANKLILLSSCNSVRRYIKVCNYAKITASECQTIAIKLIFNISNFCEIVKRELAFEGWSLPKKIGVNNIICILSTQNRRRAAHRGALRNIYIFLLPASTSSHKVLKKRSPLFFSPTLKPDLRIVFQHHNGQVYHV